MKAKVILLIVAFCFLSASIVLAGGKEGDTLIQEKYLSAREHFRKGEYEAAVKGFEEVIKIDPGYKVAAGYLNVAKARLQARTQKEIALQKKETGLEEVATKKQENAVKRESTIAKVKDSWNNWLEKEREKKKLRVEEKKAKAQLKKEKQLASFYGLDQLEAIGNKAKEMMATAEKRKALEEARENKMWVKIESLPSPKKEKAMADICMSKAEAAYREGNYDEAVKEWQKVCSVDPANSTAPKRIEQVRMMIERNKQAELEKAKQESIAQAKEAVIKYCARGKFLYGHKGYKGSVEEFQKALAIDPGSKEAKKGLLKAQRRLGARNLKEEKVLEKRTQQVLDLVGKGNKYLGEGKFPRAKKCALKALEIDPDSKAAKNLLGNAEQGPSQK